MPVIMPLLLTLSSFMVAQAFYYDEKPILSNEEFDVLKDELLWAGSKVAILRCTTHHSCPH